MYPPVAKFKFRRSFQGRRTNLDAAVFVGMTTLGKVYSSETRTLPDNWLCVNADDE